MNKQRNLTYSPVAAPDTTPEDQQTYHDVVAPDLGRATPSQVQGTEAANVAAARAAEHEAHQSP